MPGVGAALFILSYGVYYAAWNQMNGTGGSVLYWLTGNKRFGAPPPSKSGGITGGGKTTTGGSQPGPPGVPKGK